MPGYRQRQVLKALLYYHKIIATYINMKNTIIIITLIFLLSGCSNNHPVNLDAKTTTAKATVETVPLEKGKLNSVIKLPGQLKPFEVVDIYPKVNGFVKEMFVDRGSIVHS